MWRNEETVQAKWKPWAQRGGRAERGEKEVRESNETFRTEAREGISMGESLVLRVAAGRQIDQRLVWSIDRGKTFATWANLFSLPKATCHMPHSVPKSEKKNAPRRATRYTHPNAKAFLHSAAEQPTGQTGTNSEPTRPAGSRRSL